MKNITKSLIALFAVFAVSCSDDVENRPVVYPANAPVLSAPEENNTYVLSVENATDQVERFVWSPANFFQAVAVTYTVQIDQAGNEFANAQDLGSVTGANQLSVSVESLNGKVLAAGGEAFVEGQFEVRVKASLNDTAQPMYSNEVLINVTPYVLYPYTDLFLVGNAIDTNMDGVANDSDWDNNANNPAMFRDPANADSYSFTGYFQAGDFKMLEKKGQWQPQWGAASSSALAVNTGSGSDPASFNIAASGYYTFTVNIEAMTYTLVPYDASGAATYPTIGIIGTATPNNWDSDTDMAQSAFNPHLWYISSQLLKANQEMKFRANDAWDTSWGSDTAYTGQGTLGGPNIPVTLVSDGNYNIWFDDLTGRYIYVPVP